MTSRMWFRITRVSSFNQRYSETRWNTTVSAVLLKIVFIYIHLLQNYFDFYRANLNGEKNIESFIGSNLQCCLHATAICKNTGFEHRQISLATFATREICLSSQPLFYDQYFVYKFVYDVECILMRSSE